MLDASHFPTVPLIELAHLGLVPDPHPHRPLILVVDNEQIIADTRTAILSGWGYAVLTAYDSESALELASTIPPEVLISDVALVRMNGVELAQAVRRIAPDCKLILISGRGESVDWVAAARTQLQDLIFLPKPVHPTQLCKILASFATVPQPLS